MDRVQRMATFLAVVDAGGFAAAGRKLSLSPPVVTRAVAELEQHLGVQLLTRSTRSVRATDAGARFAANCRRILAELDEAESDVRGEHAHVRGTLTVTAPVLFGRLRVAPVVRRYLAAHPEVRVNALFVDRNVQLIEEGVDVAVRIGHLPDSSLRAIRIGEVRLVCCASPAYLERHGTPTVPADLGRHATVGTSGLGSDEWQFRGAKPVRVTPRLETSSTEMALDSAVAGLGIARLLSYQVEADVAAGRLRLVLEDFEPQPRPIHLLHAAQGTGAAKVRAFLEMAAAQLRTA